MALLQIRSTLVNPGLPILSTLLFNRLTKGKLPKFIRQPALCDNELPYHALREAAPGKPRHRYLKNILFLPIGQL